MIKKKKGDTLTVRMPQEMKENLQKYADEWGISVSALVMIVLNNYFKTSSIHCSSPITLLNKQQ